MSLNYDRKARFCFFVGLGLAGISAVSATTTGQSIDVLYSFVSGGSEAPLVQGSDGDFYGTTYGGAPTVNGTVFRSEPSGQFTTLHVFEGTDGAYPQAGLIQATNGLFYGTTSQGGGSSCGGFGCGTVFQIDSSGNLTTLHSFTGPDGSGPVAGIVQAADGNFYGTTPDGGANGLGTVFRMDASGNLTTLHDFGGSPSDGSQPTAGLIQATDGNLYGTTYGGGPSLSGALFKLDSAGQLTILHTFTGSDGAYPQGGLIQGRDGNFYGTTKGNEGSGGQNQWGTVFRVDPSGNLTTLHIFTPSDGIQPAFGLTQGTDGGFYGTTTAGGAKFNGTIFKVDSWGNFRVLYDFTSPEGNTFAVSGVIQAADGNFYGATEGGGANDAGQIFRLTIGTGCTPDAMTLCLNNGRFQVRSTWTDFQGNTRNGSVVSGLTSTDSGLFWFFGPTNWELLIKVLNGCGVNSHFWVFGAAATDVGYTIQVTDTQTGDVRTYTNPLGTTSPAITDTAAFGSCP
jgi:uncharacterized repeat protein (TIGR03803 family)